jgi:(1->4)-alpha-D-glucan 1-alpha-D-glucosylmutase
MLANATHDTKHGEDARARLAVLTERPGEWRRQVISWSRLLRARIGDIEGLAPPDRNDEYMLYQMLVGAWPMKMIESPSAEALAALAERVRGALTKSIREAKLRSGWAAPNREYEDAALAFASEALRDGPGFLTAFLPFVADVARLGVQNSLVQTVLKLAAPGVPDTYQGSELWDLSLVDPDNRRAVDYAARDAALGEIEAALAALEQRAGLFESLLATWTDGRVKLATIALLLKLRRDRPALFAEGGYRPIEMAGEEADWALGLIRERGAERLAVVVARYPAKRQAKPGWTAVARLPEGRWLDMFRGREIKADAPLGEWMGALPVAVLTEE